MPENYAFLGHITRQESRQDKLICKRKRQKVVCNADFLTMSFRIIVNKITIILPKNPIFCFTSLIADFRTLEDFDSTFHNGFPKDVRWRLFENCNSLHPSGVKLALNLRGKCICNSFNQRIVFAILFSQ
ncbi:hypothetical protein TNCT_725841 [Trichonephila clavata]|uniref:Uncharacterized protein n=1 Tax=Trichonephila clavata TaxID=2740835 RepID=A0A8X6GP10_TRICU|nr:hypothetical protein TNCT_725841 [Trichonephila clavata]